MSFTIHTYNMMLDYEFRNISFSSTFGTNLYAGLSLSEIDNRGGGVTEPNDSNYERVSISRSNSTWTPYENNKTILKIPLVFPRSNKDWGDIIEFFISTEGAPNSPNNTILYHQKIHPLIYIGQNTELTIPANSIVIRGR